MSEEAAVDVMGADAILAVLLRYKTLDDSSVLSVA